MLSLVLKEIEAVTERQAVHFISRNTRTSPIGSSVKPTVPPFICTVAAFDLIEAVVSPTMITPPFALNQS
jgi:hypothetical protein